MIFYLAITIAVLPVLDAAAASASHALESSEEHEHNGKCRHSGERFVKDYIQFQCFAAYPGGPLSTRPIGKNVCLRGNLFTDILVQSNYIRLRSVEHAKWSSDSARQHVHDRPLSLFLRSRK